MEKTEKLDQLFQAVNLREILAEPTEVKTDVGSSAFSFEPVVQTPETISEAPTFHTPEIEVIEEEPYDAERNATSMVYGLQSVETLILLPIVGWKTRKQIGGKPVLQKMRKAYQKKMSGQKLTETDQNLIKALEDYDRKMMLLSDDFIYTPNQTQKLINAAIPYCEATKLKVGPGVGFWSAYAGGLVEKIAKIALK